MLDGARSVVVVPCFDEERRLRREGFRAFLDAPGVALLFVDDGSRDGTRAALEVLCEELAPRAGLLSLPRNSGKAEAVRVGLLEALRGGATFVGFCDADLATPPAEVCRLFEPLRAAGGAAPVAAVLGARVALLGHRIERRPSRHYLGRVFASLASLLLDLPVYDTQCGAKAFRGSALLAAALAEPFAGRWCFDVELIGRLLAGSCGHAPLGRDQLLEVPLRHWADVAGSKVGPLAAPEILIELWRVRRALARWREGARAREAGAGAR
jgi:glycosyltransferase involved in cell wall biosynthesis